MFRLLTLVMIIGLSHSSCDKEDDAKPSFRTGWNEELELLVNAQPRYFRVYQPAGIQSKAPVLILLHGGGQDMEGIFAASAGGTRVWQQVADEEKFLLVVPNGYDASTRSATGANQNWNDCRTLTSANQGFSDQDDVKFISDLIDWTITSFDVDKSRVYATGVSNGGMMCYRLATQLNAKLAAVAPFIANLPDPTECGAASPPLPMMICVGTLDPLMPFLGGNVAGSNRGAVKSAAETVNFWLAANGLSPTDVATTALPDVNTGDNSTILKRSYGASQIGRQIELYTVVGGGHCMPSMANPLSVAAQSLVGPQNQDAEGARLAWDFLKQHRK